MIMLQGNCLANLHGLILRVKMARKPNWFKKNDKLWPLVINQVGYCERCGAAGRLNAHHIILRRAFAYRHNVTNGVCLCVSCHTAGAHSAHRDKTSFENWLKKERKGVWEWYLEHTVYSKKMIGNQEVDVYSTRKIENPSDEEEYKILKAMYDKGI